MEGQHNPNLATVLIVDDNPADREIIKRSLNEFKLRCNIVEAENGEQALLFVKPPLSNEKSSTCPYPDLILLDINMPRMDGLTFLRIVRKEMNITSLPVVILSTSNRDEDVVNSYNLCVNAYVNKPVEPTEFINAVQQLESFWLDLVKLPRRTV